MTAKTDAYLSLASSAVDLLRDPAVAASWDRPSALAEFSVGGLAAHLALQVTRVPGVLVAPPPPATADVIGVDEHYARSLWVSAPLDGEVNRAIRGTADEKAVAGPEAIADETAAALRDVELILPGEAAGRAVFLSWTGWSLTLEDYLVTRSLELLVHSDDLAASVGIDTPTAPFEAARIVIDTLVSMALAKHGVTAVLRALSRRERAPGSIAAI